MCCDITKQCTDGSTVLHSCKLVCTCQSHQPMENTQLYEISSLNTPAQRERLCSGHTCSCSLWRNEAICYIISPLYPVKHRFINYDIRFGRSLRNQFQCFKQQRETGISAKLSVFWVIKKCIFIFSSPKTALGQL